jgi:SNF2 family DNA or RNA helicase
MGLGKTLIMLRVLQKLKKPALVIAPLKPLYLTWPEEIDKWAPNLSFSMLHDNIGGIYEKSDIYLINPEGMEKLYYALEKYYKQYHKLPFEVLILDEGTMWKSHSAKRFKVLVSLLAGFPKYRYILSGTPLPNGYHDLWSQFYVLDGGRALGENISAYRRDHFRVAPHCKHKWLLNVEPDIIMKKVESLVFRLDHRDHIKYPNEIVKRVSIKLNKSEMKLYNELKKDFLASLDENEAEIEALNTAQLLNKMKQFVQGAVYTEHPRYEIIHTKKIEALKTLVSSGQRIVCAIQYRFELDLLAEAFPEAPAVVGGISNAKANRLFRQWNAKKIPLLIVHPKSVSHGVNIQFGGHTIVWLGLMWDLELYDQLNGRFVRPGQPSKDVTIYHLLIPGTVDDILYAGLRRKDASQKSFLQYMREVTK